MNKKHIEEDAVGGAGTAVSMGAGPQGLVSAQGKSIAGFDPVMGKMLRRKPPKLFGGKAVFRVNSEAYHRAIMGKKKYKHYASYVGKDEIGEEIRQYAAQNPDEPIILEDERTGAMVYLKYGKK